ncbi:MAG: tetratricopeptide repeat protein [Candidatus Omnitrophica bacterium]|nr:tetratricopeptide repeat protein [Candidatus Omnitrophota bacterium]
MKKLFLLLMFFLLWPQPAKAVVNDEGRVNTFFAAGRAAYTQGNYAQAIQAYENILAAGRASGPVYYNLANAYFRHGQLGRAILNYQRAARLMPRDKDLKFNFKYARTQVRAPAAGEIHPLLKIYQRFRDDYTPAELAGAAIALLGIMFGVHLFLLYSGQSLRRYGAGFAAGLFVLALLCFTFFNKTAMLSSAAVVLNEGKALFEPRDSATAHFTVYPGETVRFVDAQGAWAKIQRADDNLGWVNESLVAKVGDRE